MKAESWRKVRTKHYTRRLHLFRSKSRKWIRIAIDWSKICKKREKCITRLRGREIRKPRRLQSCIKTSQSAIKPLQRNAGSSWSESRIYKTRRNTSSRRSSSWAPTSTFCRLMSRSSQIRSMRWLLITKNLSKLVESRHKLSPSTTRRSVIWARGTKRWRTSIMIPIHH